MEPTYRSGDLVVARPSPSYGVGDVVTYDAPVGVTYRVIHRITEVTTDGYVTQGDNRAQADGWIVPFDAVHGSVRAPHPVGWQRCNAPSPAFGADRTRCRVAHAHSPHPSREAS
ncbi:hypothetical protein [Nitriliruptor sp.]|uniref:hypothetical protein n=1 Tax=Nitriliruptor sp. TaxID=2448056 RepID=UPI00349FD8A4